MPQRLYFKKCFHAAVRDGRKTTTLRRWAAPRVKAGDRTLAPGVGWLRVDAVERVEWEELAEADARADGFDSLAALGEAVAKIYPDHAGDGKAWYRVRFGVVERIPVEGKKRRRVRRAACPAAEPLGSVPCAGGSDSGDRRRLASALLAELDKAVRGNGS